VHLAKEPKAVNPTSHSCANEKHNWRCIRFYTALKPMTTLLNRSTRDLQEHRLAGVYHSFSANVPVPGATIRKGLA